MTDAAVTDALRSAGLVALADRIELWPIEKLRPYERNPRTHSGAQVDQIAASMVEFGWTNPVLIDEQGGILAGHGRLLAASKLGLTEVPVIRFEHLSEAQKRADQLTVSGETFVVQGRARAARSGAARMDARDNAGLKVDKPAVASAKAIVESASQTPGCLQLHPHQRLGGETDE